MRIIYLGNNWLGYQILKWLKGQGENIIGLVIHPEKNCKYGDEIVECSGLGQEAIFNGSRLNEQEVLTAIQSLDPQIGISVLFNYILQPPFLAIFPKGVVNLHPAYLPYGKGQYPNVWSIIEETPAGATLHYIDERIDTGDIIAQREVRVDVTDTGESLYRKLEKACIELFKENWEAIKKGTTKRFKQPAGGTYHRTKDVTKIDEIKLDENYEAKYLINVLRARTFPPYESAYVRLSDGRKIYIRVSLEEA